MDNKKIIELKASSLDEYQNEKIISNFNNELVENLFSVSQLIPIERLTRDIINEFSNKEAYQSNLFSSVNRYIGIMFQDLKNNEVLNKEMENILSIIKIIFENKLNLYSKTELIKLFIDVL